MIMKLPLFVGAVHKVPLQEDEIGAIIHGAVSVSFYNTKLRCSQHTSNFSVGKWINSLIQIFDFIMITKMG